MSLARDSAYFDTAEPAPAPTVPRGGDLVPADESPRSLLLVPFRGPRLSVQYAIAVGARVYRLKGVFGVKLEYLADGTVFASHARLPVHGFGSNLAEAIGEFACMFDAQWRSLVEASAEDLTKHALRVRGHLQACVERVEDAVTPR